MLQIPAPDECKASSGLVDQEGRQPVADFNKALLSEGTEAQFWHHVPTSEALGSTSPPPPSPPRPPGHFNSFSRLPSRRKRGVWQRRGNREALRRPPSPLIKGAIKRVPCLFFYFFSFRKQNIIPERGGGAALTQGGEEPAVCQCCPLTQTRLIRFQGSLRESENKCAAFATSSLASAPPPHAAPCLSAPNLSWPCRFLFFLFALFSFFCLKWKLGFPNFTRSKQRPALQKTIPP